MPSQQQSKRLRWMQKAQHHRRRSLSRRRSMAREQREDRQDRRRTQPGPPPTNQELVEEGLEGTIKRIVADRGFGFILCKDGREFFFHRSGLAQGVVFENLYEGQ